MILELTITFLMRILSLKQTVIQKLNALSEADSELDTDCDSDTEALSDA